MNDVEKVELCIDCERERASNNEQYFLQSKANKMCQDQSPIQVLYFAYT